MNNKFTLITYWDETILQLHKSIQIQEAWILSMFLILCYDNKIWRGNDKKSENSIDIFPHWHSDRISLQSSQDVVITSHRWGWLKENDIKEGREKIIQADNVYICIRQ